MSHITKIGIKDYDEALSRKIENSLLKDENGRTVIDVIYSPIDLVYESAMKSQKVVDRNSIRFPLINIHRESSMKLGELTHRVLNHKQPIHTIKLGASDGSPERVVQFIYLDLIYQLDVLGQDESTTLELLQELIYLFLRDPNFRLPKFNEKAIELYPELGRYEDIITVLIDSTITENTALQQETDTGKIYRYTMSLSISDALIVRDSPSNLIRLHENLVEIIND